MNNKEYYLWCEFSYSISIRKSFGDSFVKSGQTKDIDEIKKKINQFITKHEGNVTCYRDREWLVIYANPIKDWEKELINLI